MNRIIDPKNAIMPQSPSILEESTKAGKASIAPLYSGPMALGQKRKKSSHLNVMSDTYS
jgi:hypothetical protein